MKMPTAVVRHKVPAWKPGGDQVSKPRGEGASHSPEGEPLPAMPAVPTATRHGSHSPGDARAPPVSRDEEVIGAMAAAASLSLSAPASSGNWDQSGKRFPILGPTRQDTELYFRRRRSARHKIRTASRPLMTRSADRVVPADYDPTRLTCTSLTPSLSTSSPIIAPTRSNTSISINNNHHLKGFRYVDTKVNPSSPSGHGDSAQEATTDSQAVTTSLPVFQHVSGNLQKSAKPSTALVRAGSSPPIDRTSLPIFDRSASFHGGSAGSGLMRNGPGKRYEIPIKFLSESGQIRTSELTHRVNKTAGEVPKAVLAPKTLQPSKYGFHRRSKSPTFKRLVEVAEKLQDVVIPELNHNDSHASDKSLARLTSASVARFPALAGAAEGGEGRGGEVGGGGGEEKCVSDEEATNVQPQEFLPFPSSSIHRQNYTNATDTKFGPSVRNSAATAKRRSLTSKRKVPPTTSSDHNTHDVATSTCDADFLTNGWGAWEVDSTGAEVDPHSLPVSLGFPPPTDSHTELHLFLPRLADTASEESGSGVASKASPERHHRPRLPHTPRASGNPARGGRPASETHHPHTSMRPPQHPHVAGGPAGGERNSRPQSRKFTSSPVRVLRRDRTPKPRCSGSVGVGEVYESYEPFIRGEHLKEKLEDFPTLISLDQD